MPSLLAAFTRSHADVEVTAVESYGGMLLRDLRDGRRDAVVAPSRDRFPNAHVLRALCRTRIGDPFLTINARGAAACCRLCRKRCKHAVSGVPIDVAAEPCRRPVLPRCFHVAASNHARRRRRAVADACATASGSIDRDLVRPGPGTLNRTLGHGARSASSAAPSRSGVPP
jgi:hypothetical protein